jgi:hypothetical protein
MNIYKDFLLPVACTVASALLFLLGFLWLLENVFN